MEITDADISGLTSHLMAAHGVSLRELSRRMGKHHTRVSEKLAGKHPWKFSEVALIAGAFEVTQAWFLAELEIRVNGRSVYGE